MEGAFRRMKNPKKIILTLIQILVTGGILAFLFKDPKRNHEMAEALWNADKWWIIASIVTYGLVEIFAVARWQVLLRVQGVKIGWWRLLALLMIGLFFNLFMPGGTGGDVVKIFYLLKETEKKTQALLAVLMDRLIGLLGVITIAGIVITIRYHWLTQTKVTSGLLYALLLIFGGSVAFIGGSYALTASGLVHKLPKKMPMRDKFVDLSVAYNAYGRAWRSTLLAFALAIPVHIGSFAQYYLVARALPDAAQKASLLDFFAIMPIVNTITCIPISVSGAGVREGLFTNLLGDLLHIKPETSVVISLTGFSVLVFWGLVGGVIYLFYRPTEHAKLVQIEEVVETLEHEIAEEEEATEQASSKA
jgi:uncharacterized protein (TIRG00374 family)